MLVQRAVPRVAADAGDAARDSATPPICFLIPLRLALDSGLVQTLMSRAPQPLLRHGRWRVTSSPASSIVCDPAGISPSRLEARGVRSPLPFALVICASVLVGRRVPCSRHVFFLTSALRGGFQQPSHRCLALATQRGALTSALAVVRARGFTVSRFRMRRALSEA